ncbi:HET-domain-containing protein, partial [Hyaloscypha variabilis F]
MVSDHESTRITALQTNRQPSNEDFDRHSIVRKISLLTMQYYPLDPDLNEIRLMTLLPCVEDQSRVRCTFEHTSLINPPEFCALSYCWGDPNITREITINGSSCQITTNLESALYQLGKKGYTRLWVDAICINQDDKVEKSQQLLWMGSIYRRAKEVVAWLGEEDVISAMVMDYIAPLRHSPTVTGPGSNLEIADFISFLERPYWSRVWIIQELALAKHTTIHCGGRQMSWAQFLSAFRSQERDAKQSASRSLKHLAFVNAKNLIKFHQDASKINPVRFIEALERSSEAKSTDPRDKAFALLELVYDSALYIPVPNYRQSAEDICIAITLSVVGTTSNLDIIPLLGCGCD